jgi:hypothetical protein
VGEDQIQLLMEIGGRVQQAKDKVFWRTPSQVLCDPNMLKFKVGKDELLITKERNSLIQVQNGNMTVGIQRSMVHLSLHPRKPRCAMPKLGL